MTFKKIANICSVAALIMIGYLPLTAQLNEGQSLDKIVAIVGNEIIMQSDIETSILMMASQNPSVDTKSEELRKRILDNLIDEKLMITKAIEDSITVSNEEVEQRLDFLIQSRVQQVGSEKRLEDIYGMSISRLKYEYRDMVKKQMLAQKLQQTKFGEINVSPAEVEEFYKEYKDSLPQIPEQVDIYHIVKNIESDATAKEDAAKLAQRVRDSIVAGGDFAEFAKRHSDDPNTREDGGDLGWFDKGKLYPDFEQAAFALQEDETSLPVETPFGIHIIQTLEKKPNSIHCRHILFKIGQTTDDRENAKNFLLDIKKKVEEGKSFEEFARKHSDDKDTRGFGGSLGKVPLTQLPESVRNTVMELPEGGVTEPMPYNADPTKPAYHIMYKKKYFPEHEASFEDDYKQIELMAKNLKQQELFAKWLEELREEMYWEIKE